jgi:hypothetical protein
VLYLDSHQQFVGLVKDFRIDAFLLFLSKGVGHQQGYEQFDKVLLGLLRRILDNNKRVQEAACSAFATLEEVLIQSDSFIEYSSSMTYMIQSNCHLYTAGGG